MYTPGECWILVNVRLFLVRHGQTPSNVANQLDTASPGPDLTDLGRRQAEALPGTLGGAGIEAVYASTLVRTQQTAAPLAAALGLEVQVRAGLREITAGDLEKRSDDEAIQTYLSVALGWAGGALRTPMPGTAEDGVVVLGRFDEVVDEIVGTGVGTAVAFSHGAMIRAWTAARCENVTADFAAEHRVSNTGAVVVVGSPGRWFVERWEEQAIGRPGLEDGTADGAAAETLDQ
jgi:probable phosphoglycerate mutase